MLQLFIASCLLVLVSIGNGQANPAGHQRIVGGVETTIEKWPFVVSLQFYNDHRCGGTIITFDFIIVAANCVLGLPKDGFSVVAGVTHRSQNGTLREVKDVVIHEEFDAYYHLNDIALVILKKALVFTSNIQSATPFRAGEEIRAGTRAYVAGWGGSIDGQNIQERLHYTDLYLVSNKECSELYQPFNNITEDMICASPFVGERGLCYGDFGGPLVVEGRLYGIASWAIGCGEKTFPSVFVKIPAFRDWISGQIEKSRVK